MRVWGVTYDTGFTNLGTTTHEPFDPDLVAREMRVIHDELGADAVRVTGGVADRLEVAARHAAAAGLEVWYCPFTNDLTPDEVVEFARDAAGRAERLRREGAEVRLLVGSELSLMTRGLLPGDTLTERAAGFVDPAVLREVLPRVRRETRALLDRAAAAARERFGGPVGYASLPLEDVDWDRFDLVATDAGYRDETNAAALPAGLAALAAHGKPFAITEFGCAAFTGASRRGSRSDVVAYDEATAQPIGLTERVVRDEAEQATYLRELLDLYDDAGADAAFVQTFAARHLPTSDDPERDLDVASFGIVKVLPPGRTGTAHPGMPWEPKAAFHVLAEYGRARRAAAERH